MPTRFYVKKQQHYVTINTEVLRDKQLSLKAKGLYALITSLPPYWDMTLEGLECILKEGSDAIRSAMNELITQGYVERGRIRDEKGRLGEACYIIREGAKKDHTLFAGFPTLDNQGQYIEPKGSRYNREKSSKKTSKKDKNLGVHFANERKYTREELDALITDPDDIDI